MVKKQPSFSLPTQITFDSTSDSVPLPPTATFTNEPGDLPPSGENDLGPTLTPDPTESSSTWIRSYGSNNWIKAGSIVIADDGYYVAGYVTDDPYHLFIIKLDAKQNIVWKFQYGFDCGLGIGSGDWHSEETPSMFDQVGKNMFSTTLTSTQDGGVIAAFDTFVIRLDAEGREIWSNTFQPSVSEVFTIASIVEVHDGFLLAGHFIFQMLRDTHPNEIFLIKIDKNGNYKWAQHYAGSGGIFEMAGTRNESYKMVEIHLTPDAQHIILGGFTTRDGTWSDIHTGGLLMKLDLDGDVVWNTFIEPVEEDEAFPDVDVSLNRTLGFRGLDVTANGDILMALSMVVDDVAGPLILRFSSSGELLWSRAIHSKDPNGGTTVTQIQEDALTGDIFFTGYSTQFEEVYDPTLINWSSVNVVLGRVSPGGDVEWVRVIGKTNFSETTEDKGWYTTEIAYAFTTTPNGSVLIAGTADGYANFDNLPELVAPDQYDLLLMKTDPEGYIDSAGGLISSVAFGEKSNAKSSRPVLHTSTIELGITPEELSFKTCDADIKILPLEKRAFDATRPMEVNITSDGKRMLMNQSIFVNAEDDPDGDSLNQVWENIALQLVQPLLELDEEEEWFDHRSEHHVAMFVRVSPFPETVTPGFILFQYAVTWALDYGGLQEELYPIENHRGDVELIILAWRVSSPRSLWLEWVYTSAHDVNTHAGVWHVNDETCNRAFIADTGSEVVGTELMCETLQFKNKRVFLQVSENKHALYPSTDICENHATLLAEGGKELWGEDCGWSPSDLEKWWMNNEDLKVDPIYKGDGTVLFNAYNVGEPSLEHQLVDDLNWPGTWRELTESQVQALTGQFPHERIWSGNSFESDKAGNFCGGLTTQGIIYGGKTPLDCCGTVGNSLGPPLPIILANKLGPTVYRVKVKTKNRLFAGTDAKITITLYGLDGPNPLYSEMLDGSFESGETDIFHIGNPTLYVGSIATIGLQRDDSHANPDAYISGFEKLLGIDLSNSNPDWYVESVEVTDKTTGQKWTFKINEDIQDTNLHIYNVSP